MIYIIAGIVIGFIVGFTDFEDFVEGILGALLGFILGCFAFVIVGLIIGTTVPIPMVETIEKQEIVALTDSNSIGGQKYLFSGYIKENLVCRYVINTEKGKHIEEIRSNHVYIKEGDYEPTVIKHKFAPKSNWYYWFCIPISSEEDYTEFLVPENTVTSEYNIDLQ